MTRRGHSDSSPVIALDLGGTKLATALVSARGEVLHSASEPTETAGREACLRQLIAAATQAQRWASVLGSPRACAIGISVPGLVRRDGTVWAPNLPGWKRVPVGRRLSDATGLPAFVESDRNASIIGEAWRGAARGARDAIYLIVGTGIGAGILSGGKLVRGAGELSGCAGWMVLGERAGVFRSLEERAAGPAIAAAGAAPSAAAVFAGARRGHRAARAVIEETAFYLGLGVANLISLFNPEVIVLGGGVGTAGPLLLVPLRRVARRWAQPLAARQVRIVASRLGGRAPLLGAARLALDIRAATVRERTRTQHDP